MITMKQYHAGGIAALSHTPGGQVPDFLKAQSTEGAWNFHHTLAEYAPTPLVGLVGLAQELGVRAVFVKDESHRFGLNAFKGLGGIYALTRTIGRELGLGEDLTFDQLSAPELREKVQSMVFVTTTDGNHGRGVAWAAHKLGCQAHVYLPAGSAPARAQAILDVGAAEATILDLGYDDAVRYAARMAREKGWYLIQDTSWPGYEDVPAWIVQGYTTLAREAADQLAQAGFARPTHVFLQAGVGAMAGGVLGCLADRYGADRPLFAVAEPEDMACIYASAQAGDGQPHPAAGRGQTIMAGLNCGEPCTLTWPVLRDLAGWYFTCPDAVAEEGMRLLGRPAAGDPAVISGESGGVTAGLLRRLCTREDLAPIRREMGLDETSVVLLLSTEGDTDPDHYRQVVGRTGR